VDLSHPSRHSINDGIPKYLCSLTCITIDMAIEQIRTLGRNTMLAKIDIKSAFHLLLVYPANHHLLAIKWNTQVYIDACLPFELCSAPKLFSVLSDLISWILKNMGVSPIMHFLDDFLTLSPPSTLLCSENLQVIQGYVSTWVSHWLRNRGKDCLNHSHI